MTTTVRPEESNREDGNAGFTAVLSTNGTGETESSFQLDVINDLERGRWDATLGGDAIGELTYRFVGGRVVLLSTWVNPAYRNRRVATELIHRVLDEIRDTGKKITIICPVVGEFIARNPGYIDLIDTVHPGSGAYPHENHTGDPGDEQQLAALTQDLS